jgi:molecular chaperone DnaJ
MAVAREQDLYSALGVSRTASADEIRKTYRKLARKHHPDVNPGNKAAEDRFKEISGAYDVLSDPAKRKLYDEFGAEGLRGGFDPEQARAYKQWQSRPRERGTPPPAQGSPEVDLDDLFGDLFSKGAAPRGRRGQARPAAPELHATVEIDFAQAIHGTELHLELPVPTPCPVCHGSGDKPGTTRRECPTCHGSGHTPIASGPMRLMTTCPTCHGEGELRTPCERCHGDGTIEQAQPITVRIPPGADDGTRLRVAAHNLVIETRVRPHPFFRREGLDLHLRLPVTLDEALNGAGIDVPTPGGMVRLRVPPRSQPGTKLRLRGKGVHRDKERGDLYAELDLRLPDKDDAELARAARDATRAYSHPVREGIRL